MVEVKDCRYFQLFSRQCSNTVETEVSSTDIWNISSGICQWKNFENPSTFAKAMLKSQDDMYNYHSLVTVNMHTAYVNLKYTQSFPMQKS